MIKSDVLKYFFWAFVLLSSCTRQHDLSPYEYVKFVDSENGQFVNSKELNGWNLVAKYLPAEYEVIKNAGPENIRTINFKKEVQDKNGLVYFSLRIIPPTKDADVLSYNINTKQDYFDRLEYLSFDIKKDFSLQEGDSVIPCRIYHYERSFGLTKYADISLAFDNRKELQGNDRVLILNDRMLGLGTVKFRYESGFFDKINKTRIII